MTNIEVISSPTVVETAQAAAELLTAKVAYQQAQRHLGAISERRRRITMGNAPADFMHTLLNEAVPQAGRGYEFTITEDKFLEAVERAWMAGRHSMANGKH